MRRVAGGLGSLLACVALTACGGPDKSAEKPVATSIRAHDIKQLMAIVVQPQADVFWKSAGSITDAKGLHDLTPTTDAGWLATRSAAATITEMGNLLMTPQYAEGRGADWIQFSRSLVEIGQRAEKAAADRNVDAIFDTGGTMYNVCSACHQAYPPRPAGPSAAPGAG
nr:hypothetical protein [uncultured organism]